ncbi:ABC transporter ATP-binding protein [Dietzia alimentaria]|uniref:ABC transporter ATP-binding protein n=1 Tax=Dietzia alimentaria TaxID=665550 RepID=UPI00029A9999|nr:ATP-binding cassette domain-containing protein [Dietzia alimentaria]
MLRIDGLTRRFGDTVAVDDITFDVPRGTMTGFVGANGAGKTTTMRMIMGVLQPTAGRVLWRGNEAGVADRRTFGYMPEERGLYPKQPVLDQLVYLGRLQGRSPADARRTATELLDRFGLGGRLSDKLEALSLGNQQRVQIAAAVIGGPELLVLDEPFSGLDPVAVDSMVDLLREHTTRGVPVLFSSHQLDLVERLCDQLVVLSGGAIVARGTVDELRRRGRTLHRLVVSGDAGWVRDVPGIHVVDVDGPTALLDIPALDGADALLREAMARGSVRELAEVVPTLSDIYREVTV